MRALTIEAQLLHAETPICRKALETDFGSLSTSASAELLKALQLLAALHPEESIQQRAAEQLKRYFPEKVAVPAPSAFSIFHSILNHLPWDGDFEALQQKNYWAFAEIQPDFADLLLKYPFFREKYLDMARKLYLLFDLKAEAKHCFEAMLQADERSEEAAYSLGRILEKQGKGEAAKRLYQQALDIKPKHLYAALQLGQLYCRLDNQPEKALPLFEQVVEEDPYLTEVYIRLGEAHFLLEDFERCRQYVDIALSINEYDEEALDLLAMLYRKIEQDYDKAIATYQKGLDHQVHADSGLLLGSLAEMYVEDLQSYDKGRLFYQRSLSAQPRQPERLRKYLQLLLGQLQDYGAALDAYEQYLEASPDDWEIRLEYADFLAEYIQDYWRAAELLRAIPEEEPVYEAAQERLLQYDIENDEE